jgi:hypothetical protein
MPVILLIAIGVTQALTGVIIFMAPQWFYDTVPGVAMLGPFNLHFIRDAGLAYGGSGLLILAGHWRGNYAVSLAGCTWPCFHGLFHLQMWLARGMPADLVALVNLLGIQLPAWLGLYVAWRLLQQREVARV